MAPATLRIQGISKRFGPTTALSGVTLDVAPGEVLALCGENGAGKSTLMKILSGALQPDEGHLEFDGQPYAPRGPHEARHKGLAMIYQELNLAPDLTVEENILLGLEPRRFGWIKSGELRARAHEALTQLGHAGLEASNFLRTLSNAEQQLVEIARALIVRPRLLIMDEPTSSLSSTDTARLLEIVKSLARNNVAIIYISHFLEECSKVADRFAVLRDGAIVGGGPMKDTPLSEIVRLMVGREVTEIYPPRKPLPSKNAQNPAFRAEGLANRRIRNLNFEIARGEVLGISGLMGAGRTEAVRACFGLDRIQEGRVLVYTKDGSSLSEPCPSPWKSLRHGVGLLSENRKEEGLMLDRSIADNLTLTKLERYASGGWIAEQAQDKEASRWIRELGVKCAGPEQPVGRLSGGNQQKVALARLLAHPCEVLLLDEPTRGIDVGAKAQIYETMRRLADGGQAVLFVSSYIPELLGVCDRIAVMRGGELVETRMAAEWSEFDLLSAALPKEGES